jgi:hypothetical protein
MKTTNAPNERIKRVYFTYMKEAPRYSEPSIDAVAKALHRFESYTRFNDFKSFHHQQAVGFKAHLSAQVNGRTKEALSKATLYSTLASSPPASLFRQTGCRRSSARCFLSRSMPTCCQRTRA